MVDAELQKGVSISNLERPRVHSWFGYDIFKNDPALFQSSSSGAVEPNYLIGPNDEIIVMLWGETQFRQVLEVDREGFIFIPVIGQVFVNGLNLNLLESKLFRVLSQSYASLNPEGRNPTTFLDVSIGNLRPLRIQVLGEVSQPGAYTVSPSTSLFSSLYYFNGPTNLGSLREIKLIRSGKEVEKIDFYDFLLTGKKINDQKLQVDDIVFIPIRENTILIQGEVNRPGKYELKPDEGLLELISIAGGLKTTAYLDRLMIDRVIPFEKRDGVDRLYKDVNLKKIIEKNEFFEIYDNDKITIFSILNSRKNAVYIDGAVSRPGYYDIGDSLRVRDLIIKADSLHGDAYLNRLDIVRTKPDLNQKLIRINLDEALKKKPSSNILLIGGDRVQVYSLSSMISKNVVTISGHVQKPGTYRLQQNMTVYDLLFKGGGFLDEEYNKRIFMERADLMRFNNSKKDKRIISFNLGDLIQDNLSENNFLLKPGDEIIVYSKDIFEKESIVKINGFVKAPNSYFLKSNMKLNDLILEAGGITSFENNSLIEIARINRDFTSSSDSILIFKLKLDKAFSILKIDAPLGYEIEGGKSFFLKADDIITVRKNQDFNKHNIVYISGEVKFPGSYSIRHEKEKLSDIISRAGGITANAYPFGSIFRRDKKSVRINFNEILGSPKSSNNIVVLDLDSIFISNRLFMYSIFGQVHSPGTYQFKKGLRVSDVIKNAGGFNMNYEKDDIYVSHVNGVSRKYHRIFSNHKVYDGSIIFVGKAAEEEPFNLNQYLEEITSIMSDIAQTITLIIIAKS